MSTALEAPIDTMPEETCTVDFECRKEFPDSALVDSADRLTDDSNVCEDDELSNLESVPTLAEPSDEDELGIEECRSPGFETLNMCDISCVPPPSVDFEGKLTIVFDLDETLAHARDGIIKPRPYVRELLKILQDRCEVLIWTAGVKNYAHRVVTALDTDHVVKNCICRADTWFPTVGMQGFTKDLRLLGRNLERTIIIENTPDCVVRNPLNSIIVPDYTYENPMDTTLLSIASVLDGLIGSPLSVPHYLASNPLLRLETLRNPSGDTLSVFMLR